MRYVGAISDTDILINIAMVDRFDILECLFEQIIIPQFVFDVEIKHKAGKYYSTIVQAINKEGSIFKILDRKKDEVRFLEQAASDRDKSEKIRRFTESMELKITKVQNEDEKKKLLKWIKWARDKADWLDPLTSIEDGLLGKSQHIFDLIKNMDL